jgi:hypothetical protein
VFAHQIFGSSDVSRAEFARRRFIRIGAAARVRPIAATNQQSTRAGQGNPRQQFSSRLVQILVLLYIRGSLCAARMEHRFEE